MSITVPSFYNGTRVGENPLPSMLHLPPVVPIFQIAIKPALKTLVSQ
jgi:hypothetical protein